MSFGFHLQSILKGKEIIKCPKINKERMLREVMGLSPWPVIKSEVLNINKDMQIPEEKFSRSKAFRVLQII